MSRDAVDGPLPPESKATNRRPGLGGVDGALVVDLVNMQKFSMDTNTWQATIGAGTKLGSVTQKLHDNGKRAMAHGVCPGVGIGGHATVVSRFYCGRLLRVCPLAFSRFADWNFVLRQGGLGPMSRMWGTCLDHVLEVEVVTADGSIKRASPTQNSDLFFVGFPSFLGIAVLPTATSPRLC